MNSPILQNVPSELLTQIFTKLKLSDTKRLMHESVIIRNKIMNDYFFWKSKSTPDEENENILKMINKIKRNKVISSALVKNKIKPKIFPTYQVDITMLKATYDYVICSSDDTSIRAYSLSSVSNIKFTGHLGGVWDFSFNDKYLASSSIDKTVKLWDITSGKCELTLNGHTATVRTVKIVEDRIISGGRDGTIRIWDLSGNCIFLLKKHKASVRCLEILGDELLTGSYDGSVLLWNFKSGKLIKKLASHEARVYAVLISGDYYISAGQDCLINVYSKKSKSTVKYQLHKSIVSNLAFCTFNNEFYLVTAGLDGIIGIWDLKKGKLHLKIIEMPGLIFLKTFNKYIIVGLSNAVKLYCATDGKYIRTILGDVQLIHGIEFNDNVLAIGFRNNSKCSLYICNFNECFINK
ncbi:hypothetical protein H312_03152 [Anncaliia algerae PRA339]|uniref:F-box domain-containing protein n=1 Tax=Anncaliia algerae PRA339 TaxID=1288291 RepID=A0A059EX21_9MICR|nr:hypothetical protein H312_03152 [Anncaliia algerae PRA339]